MPESELAFHFEPLPNIIEVVSKLNEVILEDNCEAPLISFTCDGFHWCIIEWRGCVLWDSNNDEREWIGEDEDEQEPLFDHVLFELRKTMEEAKSQLDLLNNAHAPPLSPKPYGLKLHADSHIHGLSKEQVDYILAKFAIANGDFKSTFELPAFMGTVSSALCGPKAGEEPVPESDVRWAARHPREYASRMTPKPAKKVRTVTVIAGPHNGQPCVLYTAFGGPLAPKEINDPTLTDDEREESTAFWAEHALAWL